MILLPGKGLGAFAGGYLIASLNTAGAFKVFGGVALFGAVFYFLIHHCYMKKLVEKRGNFNAFGRLSFFERCLGNVLEK